MTNADTIPEQIEAMAKGLAERDKTLKDLCREAGVNYTTVWRWKQGKGGTLATWGKVKETYDSMVA